MDRRSEWRSKMVRDRGMKGGVRYIIKRRFPGLQVVVEAAVPRIGTDAS